MYNLLSEIIVYCLYFWYISCTETEGYKVQRVVIVTGLLQRFLHCFTPTVGFSSVWFMREAVLYLVKLILVIFLWKSLLVCKGLDVALDKVWTRIKSYVIDLSFSLLERIWVSVFALSTSCSLHLLFDNSIDNLCLFELVILSE